MVKEEEKKSLTLNTWERYNLWFVGAKFVPFVQYDKSYHTRMGHFGDVYGQAKSQWKGESRDLSNFKENRKHTSMKESKVKMSIWPATKTHAGEMHRRFDEIQQLFNDDESLSSS